jgi:hypothetical protein
VKYGETTIFLREVTVSDTCARRSGAFCMSLNTKAKDFTAKLIAGLVMSALKMAETAALRWQGLWGLDRVKLNVYKWCPQYL